MIEVEHLHHQYTDLQPEILSDVNFHVSAGELAFLTGVSGAGKSSLLKTLTGELKPTEGDVKILGRSVVQAGIWTLPTIRRQMGVVYQDACLLPALRVFDNVALPLRMRGIEKTLISDKVFSALHRVGLQGKEGEYPNFLSGGERQRVGIARALVTSPRVILADEPTGNLDPQTSEEIFQLFDLFRSVGAAVLIATHDARLVARWDHPHFHLEAGRLHVIHE